MAIESYDCRREQRIFRLFNQMKEVKTCKVFGFMYKKPNTLHAIRSALYRKRVSAGVYDLF